MTTVVKRSMARTLSPWRRGLSRDRDGDLRRVRESVEHGGTLLGLGDQRLDLLPGRVRVDRERHLDVVEAVADIAVDAEEPAEVVAALDGRLDRAKLNAAVLRDRRHTRAQAPRQTHEEVLDRGDPVVLGREDLGVVGVELVFDLVALLLPEPEEVLDRDLAVAAACPP